MSTPYLAKSLEIADKVSEAGNNTPRHAPAPPISSSPGPPLPVRRQDVDDFPEFPKVDSYNDIASELASNFDETMSIATSDDDQYIVMEATTASDDIFGVSELICVAEEATFVDDSIKMDRNHKSLMAKNVNVLKASLDQPVVLVAIHQENLKVTGNSQKITLSERLNRNRAEIYSELNSPHQAPEVSHVGKSQVHFTVLAPKDSKVTLTNIDLHAVDIKLSDEIIAHLSPFIEDELAAENRVRLVISLHNSTLEIHDPKKKKPMRLRLKECVIEQDEDDL